MTSGSPGEPECGGGECPGEQGHRGVQLPVGERKVPGNGVHRAGQAGRAFNTRPLTTTLRSTLVTLSPCVSAPSSPSRKTGATRTTAALPHVSDGSVRACARVSISSSGGASLASVRTTRRPLGACVATVLAVTVGAGAFVAPGAVAAPATTNGVAAITAAVEASLPSARRSSAPATPATSRHARTTPAQRSWSGTGSPTARSCGSARAPSVTTATPTSP